MKEVKKYYVVATLDAGTRLAHDVFVRRCSKSSPNYALPVYGDLYEAFGNPEKLVKPLAKREAEKLVAYCLDDDFGGRFGLSKYRICTEKQLLARLARRKHLFYRHTSTRSEINRFGKLGICDLWEFFWGSELDCIKANKGLKRKFRIDDTPSEEWLEATKESAREDKIAVCWRIDGTPMIKWGTRYIAR